MRCCKIKSAHKLQTFGCVYNTNMILHKTATATMKKNSMRRVRFNPVVTQPTQREQQQDEDEEELIDDLWYSRQELETFRSDCRKEVDCRIYNIAGQEDEKERIEGIGHGCRYRMRYARKTKKCILAAWRKGLPTECIVAISKRCNDWNIQASYIHAVQTFYNVYMPSIMSSSSLPVAPKIPDSFPFAPITTKKRQRQLPAVVVPDNVVIAQCPPPCKKQRLCYNTCTALP